MSVRGVSVEEKGRGVFASLEVGRVDRAVQVHCGAPVVPRAHERCGLHPERRLRRRKTACTSSLLGDGALWGVLTEEFLV